MSLSTCYCESLDEFFTHLRNPVNEQNHIFSTGESSETRLMILFYIKAIQDDLKYRFFSFIENNRFVMEVYTF